jgi:hypothetical protein
MLVEFFKTYCKKKAEISSQKQQTKQIKWFKDNIKNIKEIIEVLSQK